MSPTAILPKLQTVVFFKGTALSTVCFPPTHVSKKARWSRRTGQGSVYNLVGQSQDPDLPKWAKSEVESGGLRVGGGRRPECCI